MRSTLPPIHRRALPALAAALLLAACSSHRAEPPRIRSAAGVERGIASWYGKPFHGRRTASGEVYDMHALTAAHPTLPLGTVVEVTHLGNGRRVTVRINDRGPFVPGRIIDLSFAAAQRLDMVREGVAEVEIRVLEAAPADGRFTVQVGAFRDRDRALELKLRLASEEGLDGVAVRSAGGWHRVQVGVFDSRRAAGDLRRRLARLGLTAVVVSLRPP
ncbi:MAG: septal ring lytic transglycosylase RlpA family protein [Acidobacteria bacterium]|nr:MAG: septal ring lytic transglycosylase RlpA family protein [Acidobacteriota bacterium]